MVQLNDELVEALDRRAAREGVSRSHVIRTAVTKFLEEDMQAEIDQEIVDAYTRMPQGGDFDVDEWGDLGRMMTDMGAQALRWMDEEEQEAGATPW